MVACEVCGLEVAFEDYLEHTKTHETQQRRASLRKIQGNEMPTKEEELPKAPYKEKGRDKSCQICLVDYKIEDQLIYLPCVHRFHEECILGWIRKQPVCPVCQEAVFAKEKTGL